MPGPGGGRLAELDGGPTSVLADSLGLGGASPTNSLGCLRWFTGRGAPAVLDVEGLGVWIWPGLNEKGGRGRGV